MKGADEKGMATRGRFWRGRRGQRNDRPDSRHEAAKPLRQGLGSLSIVTKTAIALFALTVTVGAVNLYIRSQIVNSSRAIAEQETALGELSIVRDAASALGDLKYWYADLANSLSEKSEQAADAARGRLEAALEVLQPASPSEVAAIRAHVAKLSESALSALDAYVMDDREQGNAHMETGRAEVAAMNTLIAGMVTHLEARARVSAHAVRARADEALRFALPAILITVLFSVLIGFVLMKLVARPVRRMTLAMRKLADGDLEYAIPAVRGGDEIAQMAVALEVLRSNLASAAEARADQERAHERAEQAKHQTMLEVADRFDSTVAQALSEIGAAARALQDNAQNLSEVAQETDRQSGVAAASARDAALNIHAVANATGELSASIGEVVQQITESVQLAQEAAVMSRKTSEIVDRLSIASEQIDSVVRIISDIAEKTNLLALNATIEAARAGDSGKGFAVVASEVKNLAMQTSSATGEITQQIQEIKNVAASSVEAIDKVRDAVGKIEQRISTVVAAAEEQGATTQEISRSVASAAEGANSISENLHEIAQSAGMTGRTSEETFDASTRLSSQADLLNQSVKTLIGQIRARSG